MKEKSQPASRLLVFLLVLLPFLLAGSYSNMCSERIIKTAEFSFCGKHSAAKQRY
jgi:hypothetical protein